MSAGFFVQYSPEYPRRLKNSNLWPQSSEGSDSANVPPIFRVYSVFLSPSTRPIGIQTGARSVSWPLPVPAHARPEPHQNVPAPIGQAHLAYLDLAISLPRAAMANQPRDFVLARFSGDRRCRALLDHLARRPRNLQHS